MPKFQPFLSKTVSCKLSDDAYNKIVQIYNNNYDREDVSFRELFEKTILPAVGNSGADNAHEIFSLKNKITLLSDELKNCRERGGELLRENAEKSEQLQNAINAVENKSIIPANAIIVEVEPVVDYFLNQMASKATAKLRREVTRADVLKNLFWQQIKEGAGDHLPAVVSKSELIRIIERIKREAAEAAERNAGNE